MVVAQTQRESPLLLAALSYAHERGWHIFPLRPNSKKPFKDTQGYLDATDDETQIRAWWSKWPSANIGVACGASRLVVIDEDTYKGADLRGWRLPPTLTTASPRGGYHHFYAYYGPSLLPSRAEGELAPAVCVKAQGGYVVAPPSRFEGKSYRFIDADQPIAELPERIADLILNIIRDRASQSPAQPQPQSQQRQPIPRSGAGDEAQHWLDWAMARTRDGQGDHVGVLLAQQLLIAEANGALLDVPETLARYAAAATVDPRNPFDDRDIARWIASASKSALVARAEPARSRPANGSRPALEVVPKEDEPQEEESPEPPAPPDESDDEPHSDGDDEALLRFSADDNGNAEAMRLLYGREFLYSPVYGWMRWSTTHWQVVPDAIVVRATIEALKRRRHAAVDSGNETIVKATACSHARVRGCMALFIAYVVEPDARIFDADPDTLNCQNGVVNLRTGRVTSHTSTQRFTYCVPVAYDQQADMSTWQRFITGAIGKRDDEVTRYLQICAGYSLTGHTNAEKVFYLYGPTRSGKGTYTETILALLPNPLSAEVDFTTFTALRDSDSQNFDLAGLKPARIVFASESNPSQRLNPARMKQFSGGNDVRCAFKHRDMFSYKPQFSVWLVSNHPVKADPDDDALWGRLHVIEFPISHLGHEDVALKEGMKSPANQRGVLRWLVEGARRWYQEQQLVAPGSVIAATRSQRDSQDYVRHWLDDHCTLGTTGWTSSMHILASYRAWCEASGIKPMRPNELATTLVKRFGCEAKRQAGTGARGFAGISIGQESLWSDGKEV